MIKNPSYRFHKKLIFDTVFLEWIAKADRIPPYTNRQFWLMIPTFPSSWGSCLLCLYKEYGYTFFSQNLIFFIWLLNRSVWESTYISYALHVALCILHGYVWRISFKLIAALKICHLGLLLLIWLILSSLD